MTVPSETSDTIPTGLARLRIRRLTAARLDTFVTAELVMPLHTSDGLQFRPVDLARDDCNGLDDRPRRPPMTGGCQGIVE